jgi:hypothetical protein
MYAFFDGDDIGKKIEIMLLENRVFEAIDFSEKIKTAISHLYDIAQDQDNVDVIICGGDDFLVEIQDDSTDVSVFFDKIKTDFFVITGNTLSCGIGETVKESVMNLYFAKLYGKNQTRSSYNQKS